jgi:predicted transposase/invertase (TIGR01784 family)
MKMLLDPRLDLIFKKMFVKDPQILINLINSVLKLTGRRRIAKVTVKNPDILPDEIGQKYIILDILAEDEAGAQYDIEMQIRKYGAYPERAAYYMSRLYSGQLESGRDYAELKPVIGIHFLDYYQFPDYEDEFFFCFELRDFRHPELRLTEDLALYVFELRKFEKKRKAGLIPGDEAEEWLHFFNHAREEGDKTMRAHYKNPAVHKAFDILEALTADQKVRRLAQMRETALRNEISALADARQEGELIGEARGEARGEAKKARSTAETLLKMGVLSPEQIAEATGLNQEDISEIQNSLS